jgi:hypothetical protein
MNSAEQRQHRTKVEQLEARIATLETVVDDLARYLSKWGPQIGGTLEQHAASIEAQAATLTTLETRTDHLDRRSEACRQVLVRGWRGRLRWIFHPRGAESRARYALGPGR